MSDAARRRLWLAAGAALFCGIARAMVDWGFAAFILLCLGAGWSLGAAAFSACSERRWWRAGPLALLAAPLVLADVLIVGVGLFMALALMIISFRDAALFYGALALAFFVCREVMEKRGRGLRAAAAALLMLAAFWFVPSGLRRLHDALEREHEDYRIEGWRFRWSGPEAEAKLR